MWSKVRKLCLVLTGIFLALCLVEFGLRLAGQRYVAARQISASASPDSINVLCLGESSTFGLWVQPDESYPKQLERMIRNYYQTDTVHTVIPAHIGQNSSQIANRVQTYLEAYKPAVVILMIGVNNEWSFAESSAAGFLKGYDATSLKLRASIYLDHLRVFRLARHVYHQAKDRQGSAHFSKRSDTIFGAPEYSPYPPESWKLEFTKRNQEAFIEGWRQDVRNIIARSRQTGSKIILMTYHILPQFLQPAHFVELAASENIPLVRNDLMWQKVTTKNRKRNLLLHDGWHPNKEGYALIARNVFRVIRRMNLPGLTPPQTAE